MTMTRRMIASLALAVWAGLPLQARLGETESETIARYGPASGTYPAGTPNYFYRTLTFDHAGYTIITQFLDSRCQMICFQKIDKSEIDDDDLRLLLKTESSGGEWAQSRLASIDLIWDRPDGAMARYDAAKHALVFCTAHYIKASDAQRRADQKRQLESL